MSVQHREIVVGIDGSQQSLAALRWAAREAQRRDAPLHLVTAFSIPLFTGSSLDAGYAALDETSLMDAVRSLARDAAEHVSGLDVQVRSTVQTGDPSGVLVDLSATAQLLVLGSRGRTGLLGRLFGSVSTAVPAHAYCPVGVIPLPWAQEHQLDRDLTQESAYVTGVSVGSDGSARSAAAMLYAADAAQRLDLPLSVLCAVPALAGTGAWMPTTMDFDAIHREIAEALGASCEWLRGHYPDLGITPELVDGSPIDALVGRSRDNHMVVTGTRGRGGFTGMLLGSTSQGVIHHCSGPAVVVPEFADPRLEDRPELFA